jgi:hypothetical protein
MYRFNAILVLCVLLFGGVATADIVINNSSMDFQLNTDPGFDNDYSDVWFTETTPPYLGYDSDPNHWYFRGRQEYRPDWQSNGSSMTWFQKTADEESLEMDKTIVNSTSEAFTGYTITLRVATLVEGSLEIDGVGYTMDIEVSYDYYGNPITIISIVFDQAIQIGDSFELGYVLDLSGIAPPPPPDGGFGDGGTPETPEPATLVVLMAGSFMLVVRRRRLRR